MDWSALPPLSMLRAFEAAARKGGFSAAGRELNVTHAAVAQQVRGLEARLGLALMRREGRGLALTEDGRRLADGLGAGLSQMRDALAETMQAAEARPVRVTLTPSFSASWLMPRLGAFRAAHPAVELMLNPSAQVAELGAGAFDLAIRYGEGDWPGLESQPLVTSPMAVVAAPSVAAGRRFETAADLLALPWINELGFDEWGSWMRRRGVDVGAKRDVLHLPGNLILDALRAGHGAALVARSNVADDLADGRLVTLLDDARDARDGSGYFLVRKPGRMRDDVAAFADWIRREAAREA